MTKRRSPAKHHKFKATKDCSIEIRAYIDRLGTVLKQVPPIIGAEIKLPHEPATAVGGPVYIQPEYSIEQVFFKPVQKFLTTKYGTPRLRRGTLQQAKVTNLRPTWTLETIMGCLMQHNGQSHVVRPGTETGISLFLDNLTWSDITSSVYETYSKYREVKKVYNHWTIYPLLMCDYTHPDIFKETRRRVSKRSRIFIVEHAIRLRRVPDSFYNWVRREGAFL